MYGKEGKRSLVVQEPMNTKNFFPGYYALSLLFSSSQLLLATHRTPKPSQKTPDEPED